MTDTQMIEAMSAVLNRGGTLTGRDEEFVLDCATRQMQAMNNYRMSPAQRRWAMRILERNGADE